MINFSPIINNYINAVPQESAARKEQIKLIQHALMILKSEGPGTKVEFELSPNINIRLKDNPKKLSEYEIKLTGDAHDHHLPILGKQLQNVMDVLITQTFQQKVQPKPFTNKPPIAPKKCAPTIFDETIKNYAASAKVKFLSLNAPHSEDQRKFKIPRQDKDFFYRIEIDPDEVQVIIKIYDDKKQYYPFGKTKEGKDIYEIVLNDTEARPFVKHWLKTLHAASPLYQPPGKMDRQAFAEIEKDEGIHLTFISKLPELKNPPVKKIKKEGHSKPERVRFSENVDFQGKIVKMKRGVAGDKILKELVSKNEYFAKKV
jgi:hypothetical protein